MIDRAIESALFVVVVNDEEQYSIWTNHLPMPDGWRLAGFEGDKNDCLQYIGQIWTDMRPKSLRSLLDDHELDNSRDDTANGKSDER